MHLKLQVYAASLYKTRLAIGHFQFFQQGYQLTISLAVLYILLLKPEMVHRKVTHLYKYHYIQQFLLKNEKISMEN